MPAPAPAPSGGALLRPDEVVGPQRDESRLSVAPAPPSVAPPAMSGPSGPSGSKGKKKSGEQEWASGPTVKKKPGGQSGGNRKLTSEVGEVGMMVAMGGESSAEELASSEVVGLAEVVPRSRMRRAYARISSPCLRLLTTLWDDGMPAGAGRSRCLPLPATLVL